MIVDRNVNKNELYDWFNEKNIKAKYLNSNKAVGNKMIFSNSNLALFGKFNTFPLITHESFFKLFDVTPDPNNKKTTAKANFFEKYELLPFKQHKISSLFERQKIYFLDDFIEKIDSLTESEKRLLSEDSFINTKALNAYYAKLTEDYKCQEEQFFTKEKLLFILSQLQDEFKQYAPKEYRLKIFRDKDIKEYQEAELNYLNSRLFANVNNTIGELGLPFLDNMLNASKPFMVHQTTKYKIPFPKSKEEILYFKYLDDYLSTQKGLFYLELENFRTQYNPFIDSNVGQFIILKKKNYELFEYLPNYVDEFTKKPFILKNHLGIKKNKIPMEDKKPFRENYLLENEIDKLFNKKMKSNYFSEKISKIDNKLATHIFKTRNICFSYFNKGQLSGKEFYSLIKNTITEMILYQYTHLDDQKLKYSISELLNLKLSMNEYYKGETMDIQLELQSLKSIIAHPQYKKLSKQEFLLLAGQMAYYLVSQSESHNRTFRLVEHYLKTKNIKTIKKHLRNDLERYKHKIYLVSKNSKFKNAYVLLSTYDNNNQKLDYDDIDLFLVGLMTDNIFYTKAKEDEDA